MNMGASGDPFPIGSLLPTSRLPPPTPADHPEDPDEDRTAPGSQGPQARPGEANKEMAEIFKSLADENRLQILRILMREGGCTCPGSARNSASRSRPSAIT